MTKMKPTIIFNHVIKENWVSGEEVIFILQIGREAVSQMKCNLISSGSLGEIIKFDSFWIIDEIETKPDYRGKGFGTILLKYGCVRLQKKHKLGIIAIPAIDPTNPLSLNLKCWYKKCGFTDAISHVEMVA